MVKLWTVLARASVLQRFSLRPSRDRTAIALNVAPAAARRAHPPALTFFADAPPPGTAPVACAFGNSVELP
jgi:hypothetical protein